MLLAAVAASGQITGLSFEVDTCFYANLDTTGLFDPNNELPGYTTYRVYADFTQPGDQLQAVYALGFGKTITAPWTLAAPCGCFDHAFGTSIGVGVNPVMLDAFPDLACHLQHEPRGCGHVRARRRVRWSRFAHPNRTSDHVRPV
jgi:hypothetical protein